MNRQYEAERGKNAKGGRPQVMDRLHTEIIVIADDTGAREVRVGPVIDLVEAVLRQARVATKPLSFSRPPFHIYPDAYPLYEEAAA